MAVETAGVGVRTRRRRRGGLLREEALWGWLLQIPNIIGLLVFAAGPLIASLVMIFMHWQIITPPTYAGLDNFNTLFSDPLFAKALYNTVYITVLSVPLYMALGLLLAKALIWMLALGSGTSGGVLAPLLIIGAGLGTVLGPLLPGGDAHLWPLVCMAASRLRV